jgi:hypothetical protein
LVEDENVDVLGVWNGWTGGMSRGYVWEDEESHDCCCAVDLG